MNGLVIRNGLIKQENRFKSNDVHNFNKEIHEHAYFYFVPTMAFWQGLQVETNGASVNYLFRK